MASDVRIGVVGPLTGPRAEAGALLMEAASRGLVAARQEVPDLRIAFEAADDRGDPDFGAIAARGLITAGVHAVIGHCDSPVVEAVAPLYREAGIPLVLCAATRPGLAAESGAVRLCPTDQDQIEAIVGALAGAARIAVASESTYYARRLERMLAEDPRVSGRVTGFGSLSDPAPPAGETVVLVGNYPPVLDALYCWRGQKGIRYLACDECSLPAFLDSLPDGLDLRVAMPDPDFIEATRRAVILVARHASGGLEDLLTRLLADPGFENGEARGATFRVEPVALFDSWSDDREA